MAKDAEPFELSEVAKLGMEHALTAMDGYFDALRKTISCSPSGGSEFGEKLKSYAEKNVTATQDFIRRLSKAEDYQDTLRLQTEFMRTQLNALREQTRSLGEAYAKVAAAAAKNKSNDEV